MFDGDNFQWTAPSSWPWFVWAWLAFLLFGWARTGWKRLRSKAQESWPSVQGLIEKTEISQPKRKFLSFTPRGQNSIYTASIRYSYSFQGSYYSGEYRQAFYTEQEAEELIRDLAGKTIGVHYNANKPSQSGLTKSAIDAVLATRAPIPPNAVLPPKSPVPWWLKPFLKPAVVASFVGFVISLWVHILAILGIAQSSVFWVLHIGVFVVWFPAVLVGKGLAGNTRRNDFWKVALADCPEWMRYTVYGSLGYAMINFAYCIGKMPPTETNGTLPIGWRLASGHWMAFYSAALALLYSAARRDALAREAPPSAYFQRLGY